MSCSATYHSPLGTIVIESDGKVLTGLRFADKLCESPDVSDKVADNYADADTKAVFAEVRPCQQSQDSAGLLLRPRRPYTL